MLKQVGLILVVGMVFGGLYLLSGALVSSGTNVGIFVDDWIPFVDFFVVPYASYFLFLLIPFLMEWKNWEKFKLVAMAFLVVIIISNLVYLGWQSEVERPRVSGGFFSQLIKWIYSGDRPVNALPSLHASLSFLVILFAWRSRWRVPVGIWGVLIIASTVLIKQHVILDLVAGLLLAWIVFRSRERLARVFKL